MHGVCGTPYRIVGNFCACCHGLKLFFVVSWLSLKSQKLDPSKISHYMVSHYNMIPKGLCNLPFFAIAVDVVMWRYYILMRGSLQLCGVHTEVSVSTHIGIICIKKHIMGVVSILILYTTYLHWAQEHVYRMMSHVICLIHWCFLDLFPTNNCHNTGGR